MPKGQTHDLSLVIILVFTLLVIIGWVGLEVFRNMYQSTIPEVVEDQMRSLNPKIETATLKNLTARLALPEDELKITLDRSSAPPTIKEKETIATGSGYSNSPD
jgi:hypothetical protein